jgi:hypothetical protein
MAQGHMTRQRRLHAIGRSITHLMVASVVTVRHIRSKRARSRAPVPFGSAQPSHGRVHDTNQLVELPLNDIIDARLRKKKTCREFIRSRCIAHSRRTLACVHHATPCRATQRLHGPPDGLLSHGHAWAGLGPHGSARNQAASPRRGVSCSASGDSKAGRYVIGVVNVRHGRHATGRPPSPAPMDFEVSGWLKLQVQV